jgi:hypothetical protein
MSRVNTERGVIPDIKDAQRSFHRHSAQFLEMKTSRTSRDSLDGARFLGSGGETLRSTVDSVRRSTGRILTGTFPVLPPRPSTRRVMCDVGITLIDGGALKRSSSRKSKIPSYLEGEPSLDAAANSLLGDDARTRKQVPEFQVYGLDVEPEDVPDVPMFDFDDPNMVIWKW